MDGAITIRPEKDPLPGGRGRVQRCVIAVCLGAAAIGCDHRMSLQEFLELEQAVRQERRSSPSTQPAVTQAAVAALLDRQLGPYRVGPGDVLSVSVTGLDQPAPFAALQVRISRNGTIDLPSVEPVKVADCELEDVEEAIRKAYVPAVFREVTVHVSIVSVEMTEVLVLGAVMKPGLTALRRTERNLLYALCASGGVTDVAAGQVKLRRIRRPDEEVTLDLTSPEGLKACLALAPLEKGDIISVQTKPPSVFIGGLVNAPRPMQMPSGTELTVLQAIASAGGLRTDVTPREATLIRRMPDGRDVHVRLDMDRITTGKDPNITLAIGDILWVPDTLETRVQDWINRNIYLKGGFSTNVSYNVSGVEWLNYRELQKNSLGNYPNYQNQVAPFGFMQNTAALQSLQNQAATAGNP